MNPQQQQLFEVAGAQAACAPSSPASAASASSLRAIPQAGALPRARELWVAVQSNELPDDLVRRAQGFTPRVAAESSDALLLELAGSVRLFGGLPALLKALRAAFPRPLRLALAPTPLAAVVLARAGCNCCILSMARLKGRLAPLPLAHLGWPDAELARLTSMGVRAVRYPDVFPAHS
jgi:protein ImuB